ncbi:MBOAT family O-acyltransferase [Bradyrhizobium diazoefficiens]|uniref:MBOAT family O-acyltransferase n=1 Tax=Bradyrhizobium diazoefficiens TaxID=1355477 RepID=UPI003518B499
MRPQLTRSASRRWISCCGCRCRSASPSSCSTTSAFWSTSRARNGRRRCGTSSSTSSSFRSWCRDRSRARASLCRRSSPNSSPMSISRNAAKWILTGFFFKLYVANNLNEMTSYMDYPLYETVATQDRWLLVFLYSYQIYADFFGYSAIALGLGLLFGYRLPVNFDLPYISASFSEFWTRWHISLSVWLRTYLYIPLGGNRKGPARTGLNLMIVMTLGGLWHGASLSYALWGMLHGLLLVVERPFLKVLGEAGPVVRVARVGVVFFCVTMLWIFFKLPSFDHALGYLAGMFTPTDNPNPTKLFRSMALLYALPVLIQHLGLGALASGRLRRWEPYLYGALAALAYLEAGPDAAFIYFQF